MTEGKDKAKAPDNPNSIERYVDPKVLDISKHSLLGRWISKEVVSNAGLTTDQVAGKKMVNYKTWLAQVVCEPFSGYYLIQIYKAGNLGWDEDYQELKHINDLQRHKFYSTMEQALEPFKVQFESGPNSIMKVNQPILDAMLSDETEHCHCGRPVVYHSDDATNQQSWTRGLCEQCDAVRCDVDPTQCPFRKQSYTATQKLIAIRHLIDGSSTYPNPKYIETDKLKGILDPS